jgi:Secretion system C-terminal sorting domain
MKKIGISIVATLLLAISSQAQVGVPIYELERDIVIYPVGPSTTPITIPFSLNADNSVPIFFSVPDSAISFTVSLKNQVFTGLGYANLNTGLSFGGGATLSKPEPGEANVLQAASIAPYNNLNNFAYGSGGPKNFMFTSNPYATGADLGTGLDGDGYDGSDPYTGAVSIFTAAQVLHDNGTPMNSRVYFGDVSLKFSQPVKNPAIHLAGLGGSYRFLPQGQLDIPGNYKVAYFTSELELANTGLSTTLLSSNSLMTLLGNNLYNNYAFPNGGSLQVVEPVDNFGAMTGSVRINGTVQELIYRVYLKGSPNSSTGINWSAQGMDSTLVPPAPLITGATRDPFTGDVWWVSSSFLSPYQQISGNVFIDKDGLTDSNITKSGGVENIKTNATGLVYANLLDAVSGLVVATMAVTPEGVYLFDSVAVGSYVVQLTKTPGTVGALAPVTALPVNWVNTGEKNGTLPGSDGVVNGKSDVIVMTPGGISTNNNFGIEKLPNSDPKTQTIPSPITTIPAGSATTPISGIDPEQGVLGNTNTIQITKLPTNSTMFYNGLPVTVGQIFTTFDPTKLSYTNITPGSLSTVFEYAFIDAAGFIDPTPATYVLNWNIPLSIIAIELAGQARVTDNILNITLQANMDNVKALALYRSETGNGQSDKLIKDLTPGVNNYAVVDANVVNNKTYYYTAVVTDKDGTTNKSKEVTLVRAAGNEVNIYPNPVISDLTVSFDNNLIEAATASIMDARGRIVTNVTIPAGLKSYTINLAKVANGNYTISINNAGVISNIKFNKQ